MLKHRFIKIIVSCFLVLMALWVATPKVYIHQLLNHNHTDVKVSKETQVSTQGTEEDCDFEKYNKPSYFNIFKFVFSFIPSKSKSSEKISQEASPLQKISYAIAFLRGPPANN